jgi:hypothetical protein
MVREWYKYRSDNEALARVCCGYYQLYLLGLPLSLGESVTSDCTHTILLSLVCVHCHMYKTYLSIRGMQMYAPETPVMPILNIPPRKRAHPICNAPVYAMLKGV